MDDKFEVVKQGVLSKNKILPRYIVFKCMKCGNVWGVDTEWKENHALEQKDLVCLRCKSTELLNK